MITGPDQPSIRSRLEVGRLLAGSLVEMVIKAYGAGAAVAVALSDAETVGGKSRDAIAAVPTLAAEYRNAKYVADHRGEIRDAVDYLNQNTPPREELEDAADRSAETLRGIETTYDELGAAKDEITAFPPRPDNALDHLEVAWDATPDLDAIRDLSQVAEQVGPVLDRVDVLTPVYYGGLLTVMDNFASDEIASTILVMVMAITLAVVLGQAVGFWVRRGRPGLIASVVQHFGARRFRGWYVQNLPYALTPALYAAARERIHRDVVEDPEGTLDPEALRQLELYFASRPKGVLGPEQSSTSSPPPFAPTTNE